MSDFEMEEFDLDFSPQMPDKARPPLWYHEADVAQSYKSIVDVALASFGEKLTFIHNLKPGDKVKIKEWKLVAADLNKAAGLHKGHLRNKDRPDVRRTIEFIVALNARLEAAIEARDLSNVRPSASDKKAAHAALIEKYRKLEQMKLAEFAKTAFDKNMADRLASQKHSYVSLFQKNNLLLEEKVKLEEHVEQLQGKLVEAYGEISRLNDQLRTKPQLKVVD
ncbi:hypothetical protein [Sulfitobacter sp. 1A15299]|uniref:hypothetical protein n=1 Tax=Sulfitobacter sp. 1A15299 TaxID=3368598 RepID=UPI003746CB1B|tara:strand:- start:56 stop:721 length:666 start_codon:yes stop_codon:yes gene_type:complete